MYTIAIVGAGQLGSRHLQGLTLARLPMRIIVVDSSAQSLEVARARYQEMPANAQIEQIEFVNSIDRLPDELDLVIVATGSGPRAAIVGALLGHKKVKNLVLEKFLFPALSEYRGVEALLVQEKLEDRTWVNCPRRMFAGFLALAQELKGSERLDFEATGNQWGLACNSIHMIDLFAMLCGGKALQRFSVDGLGKKIYPSKREGYVEFLGTIEGETSRGDTMKISCLDGDPTGFFITIRTSNGDVYRIDETADTIEKNGAPWGKVEMKYQSALSGMVAESILRPQGQGCLLALYGESAKLHTAFLGGLLPLYNALNHTTGDSCPIT